MHQKCSMRKWDVGIGEFPKMKELEEAKAKRVAKKASGKAKARGRKISAEADEEEDSVPAASGPKPRASTRTKRVPARFSKSSNVPEVSTRSNPAGPSPSNSSAHNFSLSLELRDLTSFEERISDSSSSIISIKQAQIELRSLLEQEQNEVNTLMWAHEEHAAIASALLQRADRLLREMGAGVRTTGSSAIAQASSSRVRMEDLDAMDLEDVSEDESAK